MPFQHFPKENVIFENARARISIPTTRVFRKYQICPQMEKLIFLEIWKMNWGSANATDHCGTFMSTSSPVADISSIRTLIYKAGDPDDVCYRLLMYQ